MINKIKSKFKSQLLKQGISDSRYYLIANLGTKLLGFLVLPILIKFTSIEEFASYDLFLLISGFLHVLVTLGMDSGISILMAESKDNDKRLSFIYVFIILSSICCLLLLTIILSIVFVYVDELFLLNQDIWELIILYTLFSIVSYHTFNFLRWKAEAKKAAYVTFLSYTFGVILGLIFLYINPSIESYLYGLVIGTFIGALLSLYISRSYIKNFKVVNNSIELIKEIFQLSIPFVPNYLANSLIQMVDRIVILMLFGKYELGLYAVILRLAMIPQFLLGTITSGFLPVMYNNYKTFNGKKLIKNFFHVYLSTIPLFFIMAYFIANDLIIIFAGKEYLEISYLFPIALAAVLFLNSSQANGLGFTIERKTHYIMYITFISLIINFVLSFIFAYSIGLAGVVFGTLFAGILKTYYYTKHSEKLYKFEYSLNLVIILAIIVFVLSYVSYIYK